MRIEEVKYMGEIILNFDNINTSLNKVVYNKIPDSSTTDKITISMKDSYQIKTIDLNGFSMYYERKVSLEPKILFELTVGFDLDFVFTKQIKEKYVNDFEKLKEIVMMKEEKPIVITNVISQASTLISNITMFLGMNPIITPPNFIK